MTKTVLDENPAYLICRRISKSESRILSDYSFSLYFLSKRFFLLISYYYFAKTLYICEKIRKQLFPRKTACFGDVNLHL